jgi:hypothetical protein
MRALVLIVPQLASHRVGPADLTILLTWPTVAIVTIGSLWVTIAPLKYQESSQWHCQRLNTWVPYCARTSDAAGTIGWKKEVTTTQFPTRRLIKEKAEVRQSQVLCWTFEGHTTMHSVIGGRGLESFH